MPRTLDEGQRTSDAHQIQTHRHQHQIRQCGKCDTPRQGPRQGDTRFTNRAGKCPGRRITDDPAGVIGKRQSEVSTATQRQRPDDAATHADAVRTTKQANEKQSKKR